MFKMCMALKVKKTYTEHEENLSYWELEIRKIKRFHGVFPSTPQFPYIIIFYSILLRT